MNSRRVFFVMIGVIGLLSVLLVLTTLMGDKLLKKQADKLVSLKLDNAVIENQQTALVQAKIDVKKYAELETIAKQVVPQDKDQARAVREIVSLANEAGIKIASISFPSSSLGQIQPKPTTTEESTDTSTPAKPATPSISQVKPVDGISGVFQLDINVTSDSNSATTYEHIIEFLDKLERNRRTAHVSQITIQPNSQNRALLTFTLLLTVYVKP
jgi:hypothetical protein